MGVIKPFIKEDIDEVKEYLEKHEFDWRGKIVLSGIFLLYLILRFT